MNKRGNGTNDHTVLAVIQNDITYIKKEVDEIRNAVNEQYLTRTEFEARFAPVQKIVYGLVGLMLVAVMGAIISIVITKP